MLDSVRTRLTLRYVGALALVLLAFSVGVYALLVRSLNERLDGGLRVSLEAMASTLARDLAEGEAEAAGKTQAERGTEADEETQVEGETKSQGEIEKEAAFDTVEELNSPDQAIAIFDAQGRLLSERAARGDLHARLPSFDFISDESVRLFTLPWGQGDRRDGVRIAVMRVQANTTGAPYLIVVAQSRRANAEELELLRRIFYFAVPVALILAGLGGFFLARKALAPVAVMSEHARRISVENLGARLPVANPRDELGQLASTFNELLGRLNSSFDQQRRFMTDASHELRTPLSVMHTTAEVTLEQPRRSESEYRDAMSLMDAQTRRLSRIVADMFTLARADAGQRPLHQSDFYLDELIGETAHAARMLAARKEVSVEVVGAVDVPFHGDKDFLRQMLLNLLDNAIRYTPAGRSVRVGLTQFDSMCEISVADSGTGIPSEAQTRIFERFYRVDESRSRPEAAGGSGAGLGLAIARWIAEAHDGRLELRSSDESGSIFVTSLPNNPR